MCSTHLHFFYVLGVDTDDLVCPTCEKHYKNRNTLRAHMKQDCSDRKWFCSLCDHISKRNYDMKVHMRVKHGLVQPRERRRINKPII